MDKDGIHLPALHGDDMLCIVHNGDPLSLYGNREEDDILACLPRIESYKAGIHIYIGVWGDGPNAETLTVENLRVNGIPYTGDAESLVFLMFDNLFCIQIVCGDFGLESVEQIKTIEMDAVAVDSLIHTDPITFVFGE